MKLVISVKENDVNRIYEQELMLITEDQKEKWKELIKKIMEFADRVLNKDLIESLQEDEEDINDENVNEENDKRQNVNKENEDIIKENKDITEENEGIIEENNKELNKRLRKEEDCVKEMELGIKEITPKIYVSEEEDTIVEEENGEMTTEQEISEDENMRIRENNKRTRDSDDRNNRRKKRKIPIEREEGLKKNLSWDISSQAQKLIDALEIENTEELDILELVHEEPKNLTLEQLDKRISAKEALIEEYYYLKKKFEERRKRKGRGGEKEEIGEIYDEMLGKDKENKAKRHKLKERMKISKKVYEIFNVIGEEKLKRTECNITLIDKCNWGI
jgi:hypothetical protein